MVVFVQKSSALLRNQIARFAVLAFGGMIRISLGDAA
jgi:hypothetical protein